MERPTKRGLILARARHNLAVTAMSAMGLGCVKTQRRCDDVEWAFRQVSFLVVEASWAWSVAIDFGKLFSSSFNFSSFYTARVIRAVLPVRRPLPVCPDQGHHLTGPAVRFVPIGDITHC